MDVRPLPDSGVITEPGIYEMTADEYHRDPVVGGSLSSSGARKLLPPGCPARFRYDRDHPPAPKPHFDLGHAVHTLVLGVGAPLVDTGLDNRRGNAWKEAEAAARKEGQIPLLSQDYAMAVAAAEAVRAHPTAGALFRPDLGRPEAVIVWREELQSARGTVVVWCRAMLDWLPHRRQGRAIIPDLKTANSAEPEAFSKAMATFGYHLQAEWNRRGCQALGLVGPDAEFVDVVVEKEPPYIVEVFHPDHDAMRIGGALNRQAMFLFAECQRTDSWPSYANDVVYLSLPAWELRKWEDQL